MYPDAVCSGARSICKIELATSGVTMKGKKQNVHQHATAGEGPRCIGMHWSTCTCCAACEHRINLHAYYIIHVDNARIRV